MRLSKPYKSPNINGADGEQTEERKEEEEGKDSGGLPGLQRSPNTRKGWGVGRPFKGPHPPPTRPRPRRKVGRRNRRETGSKMAAGGLFGK